MIARADSERPASAGKHVVAGARSRTRLDRTTLRRAKGLDRLGRSAVFALVKVAFAGSITQSAHRGLTEKSPPRTENILGGLTGHGREPGSVTTGRTWPRGGRGRGCRR